ncbi:MAG: autotransporter-associated beta strand repeat-containing protein [Chthoniobacterales bacterium]
MLLTVTLEAAPSPIGTGLLSNITLGALQNSAVVNRQWPNWVDYDVDLATWTYDVYVPPGYDGTKPYGVVVYITSDPTPGVVLQTASNDKNLIWIAPRNVGNNQGDYTLRFGASLLAIYRAKELFNIDPRRVYTSGKSGGARVASALAFYHCELIKGTAPSSGFGLPRLNEVTPDYITKPTGSNTPDSFYNYSNGWFFGEDVDAINATALSQKLRSYIITRYDDYREEYFVESFHCSYEPQGQTCFLYDGPGTHTDTSDAEMEEAIDYLDRTDIFPVNANVTAGAGGFSGLTNISQSGASAVEATSGGNTTYTLTPTLTAVAAAKTGPAFYWDNANGSTVRWLWEVKNAAPTNQKTFFGLWFANETWGGGAPTSVTTGSNPGILITITQNGSLNRMVVSARSDSGGETIFYDGYFSFVPAYSTAWTSTHSGYLTGAGSPVEIRMDLNKSRWQLTFNGIKLDGTTTSIASGTQISRDNRRSIYGYWDTAVGGASFWKHHATAPAYNTWSPFTKSILTVASGALSGSGTAPSPMELRYVIASDPGLPDPLAAGPSGLTAVASGGAINLTWNALPGATSYDVKRASVSGGPYTTLQNVSSTSYTDSSAVAGTAYYYTVSAVTASGSTANAEFEVCAGVSLPPGTWIGIGADGNWQTAANWTTLPVAGNTLTFAGGRLASGNNFAANTSFGGLAFSSGAPAFTLSGNAITLGGDISNNSPNTQSINLPLALSSGAHSVTTNANGGVSIGGVISGNGSLTKAGAGTLTLPAVNTYGGGTIVNAGTLVLAKGGGAGAIRGTVTVNSGATLKTTVTDAVGYNAGSQVAQLNLTGGTFDNSGNGNEGFRTNVALTGGTMTSTGGGSFLFTVGGYGIASLASSATSTISSGLLLQNSVDLPIDVADGAAATDLLISGVVAGTGSAITKTGAGTLTLSGANTLTGNLTINGGTLATGLALGNPGTNTSQSSGLGDIGTSVSRTLTVNNGGTLSLTGGNVLGTGGSTNTLATTTLVVNQGGVFQSGLNGSGTGWWNKLGPVILNGGTIHVGSGANTTSFQGLALLGTVTVGGSTASVIDTFASSNNASNGIHLGQNSTASQSIVFNVADVTGNSAADLTIAAKLLNTSSSQVASGLTKTGVGTLTLTAANAYSGATTINGGILNITGSLSSSSGTVTVNNGGTLAGTGTVARATTVTSGGAISPGNGGGTAGTLTLSGGLTLNTGAALAMDLAGTATSDKIAVSGAFAASGTTTINLTALGSFVGSGTYPLITGATGISAGNFAVGTTPGGYVCTLSASSGTLSLTAMTVVENWRSTYFGTTANSGNAADNADPDGDGMTNAQEFAAGTDPKSNASALKVSNVAPSGNDMVISFPTVSGKVYRVERSDTLQSGSWTTVQDNLAGTGGVVQVTDAGGAMQGKRFYRVLIP